MMHYEEGIVNKNSDGNASTHLWKPYLCDNNTSFYHTLKVQETQQRVKEAVKPIH